MAITSRLKCFIFVLVAVLSVMDLFCFFYAAHFVFSDGINGFSDSTALSAINFVSNEADKDVNKEVIMAEIMQDNKKEEIIKIIAVGDLMLSRYVEQRMIEKGDWRYPFLNLAEIFKSGDVIFGNLETPIIEGRRIEKGEMIFRTDPKAMEGLEFAGFNVLSFANNHILNFGDEGLKSTIENLEKSGIIFAGAGFGAEETFKPVIIEKNGIKVGLLAYSYSGSKFAAIPADSQKGFVADMDIAKMKESVEALEKEVDLVVVSMHAGKEYQLEPSKRQVKFSHAAIDAGADIILGHHAHIAQKIEKYDDGIIFYGLGNFVFDQAFNKWVKRGLVAEISFGKESGIGEIVLRPTISEDYCQPRLATKEEAEEIFERIGYK